MKKVIFFCIYISSISGFSQTYILETGTPFAGVKFSAMAFADIDNDNDQDVIISGNEGSSRTTKLYTNNGLGIYTLSTANLFAGVDLSCIAFADVDNDSDLDVFIGGTTGSNSIGYIYRNTGNGNFTLITGNPFLGPYNGSIAFADVDNDNDQDIFICGSQTGTPFSNLYKNTGGGIYSLDTNNTFTPVFASAVAFADIDNDNDKDLMITGNDGTNPVSKLYLNNAGTFTTSSTSITPVKSGDIAFADVDNDNDKDLIITGDNGTNKITELYKNNGTGNFSLSLGSTFMGVYLSSVAFGDFDKDNDQDLLVGGNNGSSNTCSLYSNDGTGMFTSVAGTPFSTINNGSLAFADIDNDTDLDILITGASGSSQIANLYRNNKFVIGIYENSPNIIMVYPNPANNHVIIDNLSENDIIEIYDIMGKLIYRETTNTNRLIINTNSFSSAVYQYKIINKENIIQQGRLVIE